LPTTLPTLDELIGIGGITPANVAAHVLAMTAEPPSSGHVYTLHAELEGMKLLPAFEQLVVGWKEQGYALVSLRDYFDGLETKSLPRHVVGSGVIPGRSGTLAQQGPVFLV
jgi:peptidoglycan/xylan/chitin deacetylase (PgdA/CDA1 family)